MSNKCELIKAPSFALLACSETFKRKKKYNLFTENLFLALWFSSLVGGVCPLVSWLYNNEQ